MVHGPAFLHTRAASDRSEATISVIMREHEKLRFHPAREKLQTRAKNTHLQMSPNGATNHQNGSVM
jgi:hypothetical protein